jgi:hypothetical protein
MVFIAQIKKLADLTKANKQMLEDLFVKLNNRTSNIPKVKVEKQEPQQPEVVQETKKEPTNSKQVVA